MTGHIARKCGTTWGPVHPPPGMFTAGTALPTSPRVGVSPAGRKLLCPSPRPHRTTRAPYGLQTIALSTLCACKPGTSRAERTAVCLPAPGTESWGTWPSPSPRASAPRLLVPSTEDAHISSSSPLLSLPKYLQPEGIAVSDRQKGLGHRRGAFAGCWRPERQLRCGAARTKPGARGRLSAFPFNGNNALSASLQKGVSLGQPVQEGGTRGGERAKGAGAGGGRETVTPP